MRKVAVYVEGQTEYLFVREFLQAWFEYDPSKLSFNCNRLRAEKAFEIPYPFKGIETCENYFEITDVGNDNTVLSKILKNESFLKSAGFEVVIGLRDMFSKEYRKANERSSEISQDLNRKFIEGAKEALGYKKTEIEIKLHFAIMEVEAWILAMMEEFPSDKDPETTVYHPAEELKKICRDSGGDYDKHEEQVMALLSRFKKDDYLRLLESGRCASFREFVSGLMK